MDYFVSIGDSQFHEWQILALVKSFEKLNLTKNLHISLSTDKKFKKLKTKSANIYFFENKGKEKEYYKYNKWYCLFNLINKDVIKFPVTVIEPHVVLSKGTNDISNNSAADIIYQEDNNFYYDEKYYHKEIFLKFNKEYFEKYWMSLGDSIIFKNPGLNFFSNVLKNIEMLSFYSDDYKTLDKLALLVTILENNISLLVEPKGNIESNLYQNDLNYILNYKHGFKNIFHKNFYKNNKNFCIKDLKEKISEVRYTRSLDFFYNILNCDFDA